MSYAQFLSQLVTLLGLFSSVSGLNVATTRLTKNRIDCFEYQPGGPSKQILHDSRIPGLGVRVYESGTKSFVLSYRFAGRQRLITLGRVHEFGAVSEAREEATAKLLALRRDNKDPLQEKAVRGSKSAMVSSVFRRYIDEHLIPRRSAGAVYDAECCLRKYIDPKIGRIPAIEVRRSDIRQLHALITEQGAPYRANRVVQWLKAAFNWAEAEEDGTLSVGHRNPCNRVELNPEVPRSRILYPDQLSQLFQAISEEPNPYIRGFFVLLVFTGCRKSELLKLEWVNVDLQHQQITLINTKNGTDHTVPLCLSAVSLFRQLPVARDNPYVFAGKVAGRPIENVDKAWRRIRNRLGIRDIRIHDLRRTVASLLTNANHTPHQAGKLLNHRSDITARVYSNITDATKREAVDDLERLILRESGRALDGISQR